MLLFLLNIRIEDRVVTVGLSEHGLTHIFALLLSLLSTGPHVKSDS